MLKRKSSYLDHQIVIFKQRSNKIIIRSCLSLAILNFVLWFIRVLFVNSFIHSLIHSFETESQGIALTGMGLPMLTKLGSNSERCLYTCLLNAGTKDVDHHVQT